MSTHHSDAPRDATDPLVMVNEMELTAAELERRAQRLLKLSRDLLAQAAHHSTLVLVPSDHSYGARGTLVSEKEAIDAARELGAFTTAQYAQALGLKRAATMRWLAKLINRRPPVIIRLPDSTYEYLDPKYTATRAPAKQTPPEVALIDDAPARGERVRLVDKRQRKVMSLPSQGHRERQRNKRNAAQMAARQQRNGKP